MPCKNSSKSMLKDVARLTPDTGYQMDNSSYLIVAQFCCGLNRPKINLTEDEEWIIKYIFVMSV